MPRFSASALYFLRYSPDGSYFACNAFHCSGFFSVRKRITLSTVAFCLSLHLVHAVSKASGNVFFSSRPSVLMWLNSFNSLIATATSQRKKSTTSESAITGKQGLQLKKHEHLKEKN
ncbi:hypothetical protein GQX74_005460 [Glossina fuscipes]|nr:hypothetical protein GQX74_005460 [Glossina fuscipes]